MGYKPKRTLYKLDFSATEYAGLESFAARNAAWTRVAVEVDVVAGERHVDEQVKARRAFTRYTATIGVLTMDNTLVSRAVGMAM